MIQLIHGLCVQLFIVYRPIGIYCPQHFDTDETTAARRVGQKIFLIARGDKRSITAQLQHGGSVRLAYINDGLLQNMFQKSLLRSTYLIELVNVDERKPVQIKFGVFLLREVNAIRIVNTYGRRDEAAAECGLTCALCAHQ